MPGLHQALSKFAIHTRQTDVEASLDELSAVGHAQVHFGVDGRLSWELNPHFTGRQAHRTEEKGRSTGGEPLLGVPLPGVPGTGNVMSRRPLELRDVPPSTVVWSLAVFTTFSSWVIPCSSWQKNCPLHVSYSFGCVARSRLHNKPTGKSMKTMVSVDICCWRHAHCGWDRPPTDTKVLWTLAQRVAHPCLLTEGRVVRSSVLQSDIDYRKRRV